MLVDNLNCLTNAIFVLNFVAEGAGFLTHRLIMYHLLDGFAQFISGQFLTGNGLGPPPIDAPDGPKMLGQQRRGQWCLARRIVKPPPWCLPHRDAQWLAFGGRASYAA